MHFESDIEKMRKEKKKNDSSAKNLKFMRSRCTQRKKIFYNPATAFPSPKLLSS